MKSIKSAFSFAFHTFAPHLEKLPIQVVCLHDSGVVGWSLVDGDEGSVSFGFQQLAFSWF